MPIQKIIILAINIVGGIAVIGSYIWGLRPGTGGANALWGGTPAGIKSIYTISMLFSALGYFFFIYFILFKLNTASFSPVILYAIFLGILGASALWMPLCNLFLANPTVFLWITIRAVLTVVGISPIALAWVLIGLHAKETGMAYQLAIVGSIYFAFHTAILDMILWPIFFRM